jgi:nitrous oxidase accessory protein NosD
LSVDNVMTPAGGPVVAQEVVISSSSGEPAEPTVAQRGVTRGRPRHAVAGATWRFRAPAARRLTWLAAPAVGALLLIPLGVAGPAAGAATPAYDAGPQQPIQLPAAPSSPPLDVRTYGATPGNDSDDDSAAFRKAISNADAGREILVPSGSYVFKKPNVVLKTGVSIRGESGAVITAKFTWSSDFAGSSIFSAPAGANNFTLSGLRLTSSGGNALNYPLWIGNSSGSNVSRIAIRDMQIDKYYKMAISVRNGDNITIEDNLIKDALATGGGGEGYGIMIGYSRSTNNRVAGNTVQGPSMRHGILLQYSAHHNLVEDNRVLKTVYDAYDLHGEEEYSNELRNNVAEDCGEGGFGVGNIGADHANAGPRNWIHNNTVTGCKWGIHVYRKSDTQYVEDNTFADNTSYGVYVHEDEGAKNLLFARNTVRDNGSDGIRLVKAPGVKLLDNRVSGNNGYALQTDSATTGYEIRNNDFRGNSRGVKRDSTNGIYEGNLDGTTSATPTTTPPTTTTTTPTPTTTPRPTTTAPRTTTITPRTTTPRTTPRPIPTDLAALIDKYQRDR